MILIARDNPGRPDVRALLAEHLAEMYATSPAESVHALDLDALRHPSISFFTARGTARETARGTARAISAADTTAPAPGATAPDASAPAHRITAAGATPPAPCTTAAETAAADTTAAHATAADTTAQDGQATATLLGCAALKQLTPTWSEVKSMRTVASARGRGIAAALLLHLLDDAERRGALRLSLETGSEPFFAPARRLYARHGFTECPPFADYVSDPSSVFFTRELGRSGRTPQPR